MNNYLKYEHIGDFIDSNNLSDATCKAYKLDIEQFKNFCKSFTCKTIEEYLKKYFDEFKGEPRTKRRKHASLMNYFSYLQNQGLIELHPLKALNLSIKADHISFTPLSKEQVALYRKYANNPTNTLQHKILLLLPLETGFKSLYLLKLKQEDFELPYLHVKKSKVLLSPNLASLLAEYLLEIKEQEYFFPNRLGKQLSSQSLRNIFKTAREYLKINFFYDDIRDTYLKQCFIEEVNLNSLSKQVNLSLNTLLEKESIYRNQYKE